MRLLFFIALCCLQSIAICQPKKLIAVKTSQPPRIDGKLDDSVWKTAPLAGNFIQNFPAYGSPVSAKTEVRILYDDEAIYIGAYLYDDPSLIRKQITSRDGEQRQDVDYFSVFFDTYHDQQNGFQFLVTPANVQSDAKLTPTAKTGFGEFGDKTWDAVWQSQVQITNESWVVEMKIPYISLRFSKKEVQTWGLQFLRYMRRNNENDYWNNVDPNINGFINQFGEYADLKNIQPPLRLSFSPYLTGGVRINPQGSAIKTQWLRNGGMDVKYGINESFTLDATLIPDFGQVVSDNIINNLSPFEIRFRENRPFFTEGTELFNKAGLFYSRRIGATPGGYYGVENFVGVNPDYELIKNPSVVQLYNGIKFSGRTKKKLGIGVFNALTAPMKATLRNNNTKQDTTIQTEPLTNYNIIVLDQGLKGRSSVTFTNTNVSRRGEARDANVSAFDWSLFTKGNRFQLQGTARYSRVFIQKPYDGFNTNLKAGKVSGKWQYYLQNIVRSDKYDPRDLGYLQTSNQTIYTGEISYNQLTATQKFITYRYTLNSFYSRLYKPNVFNYGQIAANAFFVFKNFWDVTFSVGYLPDQHDYFLLGFPFTNYARRPSYSYISIEGSTDSRRRLFFSYDYQIAHFFNASNKKYHVIEMGLRYRFSDQFNLEISNRHEAETDYIVYAGRESSGQPIIGFVNFKDVESILSGTYNFTPTINLTLRARHYWSFVPYNRFSYVDAKGREVPRNPSLPAPDVNANINVFNLDAFFTWDFRLGSKLIIGYKNWLNNGSIDGSAYKYYLKNLGRSFSVSHGNELTLKLIYFLDYNQLKKKKK